MNTNTLMKGLLGSLVLTALGSCAVYKDPVHLTYVDAGFHMGPEVGRDYTSNTETTGTGNGLDSKRLAALAEMAGSAPAIGDESQKTTVEVCDRFKPPAIGPIPRLSPKQIKDISVNAPGSQTQLVDILEQLYKYARNEETLAAAAYSRYLKSCKTITVQKTN